MTMCNSPGPCIPYINCMAISAGRLGPQMIIALAVSRKASNSSRGSVASQVFRSTRTWLGRADRASLDFFRLDHNGKVAEHWAVLQRTPEVSTNKNTMF
jgi:predicted SnoaL-like aldol condensation-catalyzing enzyme